MRGSLMRTSRFFELVDEESTRKFMKFDKKETLW